MSKERPAGKDGKHYYFKPGAQISGDGLIKLTAGWYLVAAKHASASTLPMGKKVGTIFHTSDDLITPAEGDIKALIDQNITLGDDLFIEYGGDFADMTAMFSQVWIILVLAIVLVFGVMASLFESFRNPFIVLLSMPLMIVGVVGIYLITGETFSLISAIGMVILAGIVVNNGIVLIEYINLLRRRGLPIREACIEAGGNRLKPILMTSLTTIFGMIPLAFFGGQGAEQIQPIGQTIIGGMTISTLMTIFFTPTLYALFNREKKKKDVESIEQYVEEGEE